jgi:outer membrane lipoprotein SlyB
MKKTALLIAVGLVLAGCAANPNNHTAVLLQNPKTKETKECKLGTWTSLDPYAGVEACAKAYEKAGFVRVSEY